MLKCISPKSVYNIIRMKPASVCTLPTQILAMLTPFLKAHEINSLAGTCRELRDLQVRRVSELFLDAVTLREEVDSLYYESKVPNIQASGSQQWGLQLLKFEISTKDQGWVNDCESKSWVEASFKSNDVVSDRIGLVYNYEVPFFVVKTKILPAKALPSDDCSLQVHLRSREGAEISCNQIRISYFYTSGFQLTEKQILAPVMLMKRSRVRKPR